MNIQKHLKSIANYFSCKHNMLFDAGSPSTTLAQRQTNINSCVMFVRMLGINVGPASTRGTGPISHVVRNFNLYITPCK